MAQVLGAQMPVIPMTYDLVMKNAMVEHLKECVNLENAFFSVSRTLATDLGFSSLAGCLQKQSHDGLHDDGVEGDRVSTHPDELVFFTITKWNPGDWRTMPVSAAVGAKLSKAG